MLPLQVSRILKRGGFQYVIKVRIVRLLDGGGVWGHAPLENFGFLTF